MKNREKKMNLFKKNVLLFAALFLTQACVSLYAKKIETPKKEIIVASYGTSYNKTRTITIGGIESAFYEIFSDYKIERVFTAEMFINKLKKRDGIKILNIEEALEKALREGIEEIVIQPTFVLPGNELNKFFDRARKYEKKFKKFIISEPLINSENDMKRVAEIFIERTQEFDNRQTAICIMGHGNDSDSNKMYKEMEVYLHSIGKSNFFVGTVHEESSTDQIIKTLKEQGGYKNVVLIPMMITSGEHIIHDMTGDGDESWKTIFNKAGYNVICVFEGMGQWYSIQKMFAFKSIDAIGQAE